MKQLFIRTLSVAAFAATAFATNAIAQAPVAPAAPTCDNPKPPPKELVVKDIEAGTGRPAKFRTAVLVGYTGYFYDGCKPDFKGEEFDSSKGRAAPLGFMIGAGRVIKGWEEGLIGMKEKDSTRVLIIPPDKAYGAEGRPGKIPPNATLVFEIYMHAFVHYPSDEESKR
ncbi:FKBP-type peptidyl-prolyl cis-trans isomerase [Usitatibacter palustris]|uniref:Peptidyl-prolyl cis-trans isomerase n=1 Tax=Usitatibacter palustris TaxID=2732487 RepID=A0A6M4HDV0_9PROT|nr:FKBP-type peptidyl-prolyl cis-trans isomerase [Usitatibacter palustris]QJR16147.1 hypothetical protein DSM104440_02976 [Usitatibacter palustris]